MFTENKTAEFKREYVDDIKIPSSPLQTAMEAPCTSVSTMTAAYAALAMWTAPCSV